jgi:3-keto-5-aminohexanoate cleavage enzyme
MLDRGELPEPARVNLVFGVPGGIDASPEALEAMLRPLPGGTYWTVTAVGRHQRRMLALAILRGANGIRVGFEDNVYRSRGVLASSNAELVSDAVELTEALGRRAATIPEARAALGLPPSPGSSGPRPSTGEPALIRSGEPMNPDEEAS